MLQQLQCQQHSSAQHHACLLDSRAAFKQANCASQNAAGLHSSYHSITAYRASPTLPAKCMWVQQQSNNAATLEEGSRPVSLSLCQCLPV